ncbi:MAG: nitrous oxide-stimulated promoter family protein [Anaerohalosphaera sp.]|nr:nitrous oxide-stimulated promoter family protein [Anaerohalosphaera sp.]
MNNPEIHIEHEARTIEAMIWIYCDGNGHARSDGKLCDDCQNLADYASARLANCPFGSDKPSCNKCTIHCYKPQMRQKIQEVMRYAGPKMIKKHPVLAIKHLLRGLKKPPN